MEVVTTYSTSLTLEVAMQSSRAEHTATARGRGVCRAGRAGSANLISTCSQ